MFYAARKKNDPAREPFKTIVAPRLIGPDDRLCR